MALSRAHSKGDSPAAGDGFVAARNRLRGERSFQSRDFRQLHGSLRLPRSRLSHRLVAEWVIRRPRLGCVWHIQSFSLAPEFFVLFPSASPLGHRPVADGLTSVHNSAFGANLYAAVLTLLTVSQTVLAQHSASHTVAPSSCGCGLRGPVPPRPPPPACGRVREPGRTPPQRSPVPAPSLVSGECAQFELLDVLSEVTVYISKRFRLLRILNGKCPRMFASSPQFGRRRIRCKGIAACFRISVWRTLATRVHQRRELRFVPVATVVFHHTFCFHLNLQSFQVGCGRWRGASAGSLLGCRLGRRPSPKFPSRSIWNDSHIAISVPQAERLVSFGSAYSVHGLQPASHEATSSRFWSLNLALGVVSGRTAASASPLLPPSRMGPTAAAGAEHQLESVFRWGEARKSVQENEHRNES